MKPASIKPVRCAIYTRVSTEHGLDQEFNSLDAQYEAASAYIKSQAHAGWTLIRSRYDDGGYSGGSTERPDLQRLLDDIRARKILARTRAKAALGRRAHWQGPAQSVLGKASGRNAGQTAPAGDTVWPIEQLGTPRWRVPVRTVNRCINSSAVFSGDNERACRHH